MANDQTLKSSVHSNGDTPFTQAIKNLSNNLAIQYNQPSANEKVPKLDGDYTKWNTFWQAFTVLVDKNPKVPVISKLNKLNQAVEGEAAAVISMFEFDKESYELAKMALFNEYGDPALCANKMLRDMQNLDRFNHIGLTHRCLNCLKSGQLARDCQVSGCKEVACNGKHHTRLHGGDFKSK